MNKIQIGDAEVHNIKKRFSEKEQKKYGIIRGHVINLAREIKIYSLISVQSAKLNQSQYVHFFGWMQNWFLPPTIRINSVKIQNSCKDYIKHLIKKIHAAEDCDYLIKNSQLEERLNELKKITEKIYDTRNKVDAHLIYENVNSVGEINLKELFNCINCLEGSLCYILHYLLNPISIMEHKLEENKNNGDLENYFKNDPATQDFEKLLCKLTEEKISAT